MRHRSLASLALLASSALACFALWGCSGQTTHGSGGDDAGEPADSGTGAPGDDASYAPGDCGSPGGGLQGYETAASGTITGTNVSATICNASAYLYESRYTTPSDDYLFYVNSGDATAVAATSPPSTSDWLIQGMMQVKTPAPGVYPSAGGCGFFSFEFSLPVPPGVVCSGTGPDCAPGCSSACSGFGCEPCTAQPPTVSYGASGASDCLGDAQNQAGSWTVTLTSVEPYTDDAGSDENGPHFTVHGSVTGTLPNEDGGTDTATIAVGF